MKKNIFNEYVGNLNKIIGKLDEKQLEKFVEKVDKAKRVYVLGTGRSGLVAKNLAMRLVRLKKKTFVIGETVNPAINKGDLVVVVSGSGETGSVLSAVKVARVKGAEIFSLTAVENSPLVKLSHNAVLIKAEIPKRLGNQYQLRELIGVPERSPVKSLFEVCALIFLEAGVSKMNGAK